LPEKEEKDASKKIWKGCKGALSGCLGHQRYFD
jgi:hypothetical protein